MAGEKGPDKQLGLKTSKELAEIVKETAPVRDSVTERLFTQMSGGQNSREFVKKACELSQMSIPKSGEPLAPYVYQLQKSLKFPNEDRYDGCDGKLGPITFDALIKKFPVLSPTPRREIKETAKEKRGEFIQSQGLPEPAKRQGAAAKPATPEAPVQSATPEKPANPEVAVSPDKTITVGDSLTYQFARSFYRGTDKYAQYNDRYFKSGRSIVTMRKNLEKNCDYADAYTVGAAANDIFYKSVDFLESEFMKIIEIIMRKNPKAKIVLLTLHGDNYKGWKNSPKVVEKITELNNRLKRIAYHNANIKLIDIRQEIIDAESGGKKILAPDKLHYSTSGSKAVAGLVKDYLATGRHGKLTDYT